MKKGVGIALIVGGGFMFLLLIAFAPLPALIVGGVFIGVGAYLCHKGNQEDEASSNKLQEEIDRKEDEMKKYDEWLNENYKNARRIIYHPSSYGWVKSEMAAIDTTKKVLILGSYDIKFKDIVDVRLKTKTTHSVSTHTEKENEYSHHRMQRTIRKRDSHP